MTGEDHRPAACISTREAPALARLCAPPMRRLCPLTRPSAPAALPHRAMMHRMWPEKNNYEWPGKSPDFPALLCSGKRPIIGPFAIIFISPHCIFWPASGRSACWAIPTYAGFGAALPLIGRPTPRSEPRAGAPGRPFTTPSPPCALGVGRFVRLAESRLESAGARHGAPGARRARRLLPRPSTRRPGGLRPMRGVFQMPRGLNARFRAREAAFKERFSARKPPKTGDLSRAKQPGNSAVFPGRSQLFLSLQGECLRVSKSVHEIVPSCESILFPLTVWCFLCRLFTVFVYK